MKFYETRKLVRCDTSHKHRCESTGARGEGQCEYLSVKGLVEEGFMDPDNYPEYDLTVIDVCPRHGANKKLDAQLTQSKKMYGIEQYLRDNPDSQFDVLELKNELALSRVVLDRVAKQINNPHDALTHFGRVQEAVKTINTIVMSIDKLSKTSMQYMDRAQALTIAGRILEIINLKLPDEFKYLMEEAAKEIAEIFANE